jgi:uncharacterized membrane protein
VLGRQVPALDADAAARQAQLAQRRGQRGGRRFAELGVEIQHGRRRVSTDEALLHTAGDERRQAIGSPNGERQTLADVLHAEELDAREVEDAFGRRRDEDVHTVGGEGAAEALGVWHRHAASAAACAA